jgi:Zn-dependent protease
MKNTPMGELRFGLFGYQIRVQPGFWVLALLLVGSKGRSLGENLALALIVFSSILVHELGHATCARRMGLEPVIVVHAFGGLTSWLPRGPLTRRRAVSIAVAGPVAGLLLAAVVGVVLLVLPAARVDQESTTLRSCLLVSVRVNAFWSLINLVPMMPFDGGQILAHLLGPRRRLIAARVSLVLGCALVLLFLGLRFYLAAAAFGVAAVMQFVMAARVARAKQSVDSTRLQLMLVEASRALEAGDADAAERVAESVIELSESQDERRKAAEIFAWAALGRGEYQKARKVYPILAAGPLDPLLQGAILEADGDAERAITCLRQARLVGDDRPQVAASLVRLLLDAERYAEAALTTIEILDYVTEEEARKVILACLRGGRPVPAAELGMELFERTASIDDLAWTLVSYSASDNQGGVERALTCAKEHQISAGKLLGSAAFESVAPESELRGIVRAIDDRVPAAPCAASQGT